MWLTPDRNLLSYIVNFEFGFFEVVYKAVPHDTLTVHWGCKFVLTQSPEGIGKLKAIQDFHQHGFAHQDVRLENVCFNEQ